MNLTSLPIIGALIQRGENALAGGVQQVKERIADFHLVPRRIANFRARVDQLARIPVVTTNTDDVAKIIDLRNKITYLGTNYDSVNRMVDIAMGQVNQVTAGNVSIAAAGTIASAISGMNDVMSSAQTIDNLLQSIEQRVLTPQQMASTRTLGLMPVPSVAGLSSLLTPMNLLVGGGLLFALTRKRGRR